MLFVKRNIDSIFRFRLRQPYSTHTALHRMSSYKEREEAKRVKEGAIGVPSLGIGMTAIPTSVSSTSVSSTIKIQDNLIELDEKHREKIDLATKLAAAREKEEELDALHREKIDFATAVETAREKEEKLDSLHREKIDLATKLAAAVETAREKEEEINLCRSLVNTTKKALHRQEALSSDLIFKLTTAVDTQHKRESEYKQELRACTSMVNSTQENLTKQLREIHNAFENADKQRTISLEKMIETSKIKEQENLKHLAISAERLAVCNQKLEFCSIGQQPIFDAAKTTSLGLECNLVILFFPIAVLTIVIFVLLCFTASWLRGRIHQQQIDNNPRHSYARPPLSYYRNASPESENLVFYSVATYSTDLQHCTEPTIVKAVDHHLKVISLGGIKVKLIIWDTAGQERFRCLIPSFYRGAQGALIVYDVSNRESFNKLNRWVAELETFTNLPNMVKILVGNKTDIPKEEGQKYAKESSLLFTEVSAKTNIGIQKCFEELTMKILETPGLWKPTIDNRITLHQSYNQKDSNCSNCKTALHRIFGIKFKD